MPTLLSIIALDVTLKPVSLDLLKVNISLISALPFTSKFAEVGVIPMPTLPSVVIVNFVFVFN